ncbi:MAG: AbrB/MazE/SpoVT family DNA-binding domain-containing protein [Gemmatimonadaceae bacterium]
MYSSRLTSKHQASIPRAVREALGLGPGDRVQFVFLEDEGRVYIEKGPATDPDVAALEATLAPEWDSEEDNHAFGGL